MCSDRSKWMDHLSNVEQGWRFRILQMFQIQKKTVTSLQRTVKINPQSHTSSHRKREKWALSAKPARSLSHQHVRQSGKVCDALFTLCCMFSYVFCVCVCVLHVWNILQSLILLDICLSIHGVCVCVCKKQAICMCAYGFSIQNVCNTVWLGCGEGLFSPYSLPLLYLVLCIVSYCQSAH